MSTPMCNSSAQEFPPGGYRVLCRFWMDNYGEPVGPSLSLWRTGILSRGLLDDQCESGCRQITGLRSKAPASPLHSEGTTHIHTLRMPQPQTRKLGSLFKRHVSWIPPQGPMHCFMPRCVTKCPDALLGSEEECFHVGLPSTFWGARRVHILVRLPRSTSPRFLWCDLITAPQSSLRRLRATHHMGVSGPKARRS